MISFLSAVQLFAEGEQKAPPPSDLLQLLPPALLMFAVFYFVMIRPQKKEQASRQAMLSTLKKNDRVVTIGGIIATVANISDNGEEVMLKIDEGRIRMTRASIQKILSSETEGDKAGSA